MKKISIVLLSIAMLFTFASCNTSPAVEAYDPEIAASYMYDMFFRADHKVGADIDTVIKGGSVDGLTADVHFVDGSGTYDWVDAIITFNGYKVSDDRTINSGILRLKAKGTLSDNTLTLTDMTYTTREGGEYNVQELSITDEYGTHTFDFNIYVNAAEGSSITLKKDTSGTVTGVEEISLLIETTGDSDLMSIIISNVFAIDGDLVQHTYLISALANLLS